MRTARDVRAVHVSTPDNLLNVLSWVQEKTGKRNFLIRVSRPLRVDEQTPCSQCVYALQLIAPVSSASATKVKVDGTVKVIGDNYL